MNSAVGAEINTVKFCAGFVLGEGEADSLILAEYNKIRCSARGLTQTRCCGLII